MRISFVCEERYSFVRRSVRSTFVREERFKKPGYRPPYSLGFRFPHSLSSLR